MEWVFEVLLVVTACIILYISLGVYLLLTTFKWVWQSYKNRQLRKRTTNLSPGELWKIENKHLIENDEWDNKYHNEDL